MARKITLPAGPTRGQRPGTGVPGNGARDVRGTASGARLSPTGSVVTVGSFTHGTKDSTFLGRDVHVPGVVGVRMARRSVAVVRVETTRVNSYRSHLPTANVGRRGPVCIACGIERTARNRCACNSHDYA